MDQTQRQLTPDPQGRDGSPAQGGPGKKGRKKPRFLPRLLLFLLTLAMVLGAVAAVVFRDSLNLDSIKRWLHYRSLSLSDSGRAESFSYGGSLGDTFAVLDGDLLVCSANAISLFSGSGTQYVSQPASMGSPVVSSNGSRAAVYDAGGDELYVLGQRSLIWQGEELESILSARLNASDYLTVVTQAGGSRGTVLVYDPSCSPLMRVELSSAYVMDAALSDDNRTLAILTAGEQEGAFQTSLSLYAMDTGDGGTFTPDLTLSLGSAVPLDVIHTRELVWILTDQGLILADHQGQERSVSWSNLRLKRFTLGGDGFAAALLGEYRAGSRAQLWVVDGQGQTRTLDIDQQVLALSAAGRYVGVLTGDRLDIYLADTLERYASLEGTQGARDMVLLEDGSAILISDGTASFFVP